MTINKGYTPASGLSSAWTMQLLNQINKIQANLVGDTVSLPQLVACGSQSSGKSSVLERLTGIPFPQRHGPGTRFPTEIVFRHTDASQQITASIHPYDGESPELQNALKKYHRKLSDMSEMPAVTEEAASLIQIRGDGTPEASNAVSANVLRIEVTGSTGLHLSIVDLPGLIHGLDEEQTEDDDIIKGSVKRYLSNSNTIILAVLQESDTISNQSTLQLAREHDPEGRRTVGILTKADLVTPGAQGRIEIPAENSDVKEPEIRFFLRNPSHLQPADEVPSAQSQSEIEFLSPMAWKEQCFDENRVGIENLKQFLQELLEERIEREIPKVWAKVNEKLAEAEGELRSLGHERLTISEIRPFLTDVSMRFHQLAQDACDGNYQGAAVEFFSDSKNRLRVQVHNASTEFSDYMRDKGEKRKVICSSASEETPHTECADGFDQAQLVVTTDDMMQWVEDIYAKARGRELPGTHSHVFLAELFHEQSSRWPSIAKNFTQKVDKMMSEWVTEAVSYIINEEHLRRKIVILCQRGLEETRRLAYEELEKLLDDEKGHPITYNHYYRQKVQRARNEASQEIARPVISDAVDRGWAASKFLLPKKSEHIEETANELKDRLSVSLVDQACNEGLAALNAYYAVAMKRFVDNVCRQVIERHFMRRLPSIFCPQTIAKLSDEELLQIGSESRKQQKRRAQLAATAQNLREGLADLEKSSE
ncbi:putative dynamin GTPase [Hypoxylon sp. FL0890]|nr:putative dynamin GTPase [Hypoxylon sp. FL0890]